MTETPTSPAKTNQTLVLYPFLACPDCRGSLEAGPCVLSCRECGGVFQVKGGVPILLPRQVSFDVALAEDLSQSECGPLRRILTYGHHFGAKNYDQMVQLCGGGPILDVGGGPNRSRPQFINVNLKPLPNVDIVGDAHRLPCRDCSLSGVLCVAVLEHVRDPWGVVAEIHRTLKPGGYVYVEVPFLQHFHPCPDDFYRFTLHGLQEICRDFAHVSSGVVMGPMATFVEMVESAILLLPVKGRLLSNLVKGSVRLALYPTRLIDLLLMRSQRAHTLASGIYYLGRKV